MTSASSASAPSSDSLAIDYDVVETGDEETRRQAILATVGDSGPLLYLHGHYDVVPAFGPGQFDPRVEDGRLIGRGSSDMKGGLAAIVHAARPAAEAGARIGLVIVPDEETGGRLGAERLAGLGAARPRRRRRDRRGADLGHDLARLSRRVHAARARPRHARLMSASTTRA